MSGPYVSQACASIRYGEILTIGGTARRGAEQAAWIGRNETARFGANNGGQQTFVFGFPRLRQTVPEVRSACAGRHTRRSGQEGRDGAGTGELRHTRKLVRGTPVGTGPETPADGEATYR